MIQIAPLIKIVPFDGTYFLIWKAPIHFEQVVGGTRAGLLFVFCISLKLVSAIFYQIFIFSRNDSPSKSMKNIFYFI